MQHQLKGPEIAKELVFFGEFMNKHIASVLALVVLDGTTSSPYASLEAFQAATKASQ